MGYLANQNNEIIVDAILTKDGRDRLASGRQLNISYFALSDDEIDYTLYNVNHPLGTDFYDIAIKNLPLLEPLPISRNQFKCLLYTSTDRVISTSLLVCVFPPEFASGINVHTQNSNTYTTTIIPTVTNTTLVAPAIWYSLVFNEDVSPWLTFIGAPISTGARPNYPKISSAGYSVIGLGFQLKIDFKEIGDGGRKLFSGLIKVAGGINGVQDLPINILVDSSIG